MRFPELAVHEREHCRAVLVEGPGTDPEACLAVAREQGGQVGKRRIIGGGESAPGFG